MTKTDAPPLDYVPEHIEHQMDPAQNWAFSIGFDDGYAKGVRDERANRSGSNVAVLMLMTLVGGFTGAVFGFLIGVWFSG